MKPNLPLRVAVDTNVALDRAIERETVTDALETIARRVAEPSLIIPPSAAAELAFIAIAGDTLEHREAAGQFLTHHRAWGFQLVNYVFHGRDFVERIADQLRGEGLLPTIEVHDSLVAAEAACLHCSLLLSSDEHLRNMDFQRLTLVLQRFDLGAPVIATPNEIVRKFFR